MAEVAGRTARHVRHRLSGLHRNEHGTISILSVFTLLVFTFLLVMIVNVGAHLDDKIKMQNSADAGAHSGGVVLARGMNAVSFSNHLLFDVFAMTAFLREGRDRQSEQITPDILAQWEANAKDIFQPAEFEKFKTLGYALEDKIPKEKELIRAFGEMTAASSEFALPVFETVLAEEQIPEFQRNLIRTIPELAQRATAEVALRNGLTRQNLMNYPNVQNAGPNQRENQTGVLWRLQVLPVGYPDESNPMTRTLPVVDPTQSGSDYSSLPNAAMYEQQAKHQRRELSKRYLEYWTREKLTLFDSAAELSQFSRLWRIFTCGQLEKLLEDYDDRNLPMMIRLPESGVELGELRRNGQQEEVNRHLDLNHHFLAVMYRKPLKENGPGLFRNPLSAQQDAMAFSQVLLYVPLYRRSLYYMNPPNQDPSSGGGINTPNPGGALDFIPPPLGGAPQPLPQAPPPQNDPTNQRWYGDGAPGYWNALNQNWTIKLVPATAEPLPQILQASPPNMTQQFKTPQLGNATIRDINQINTH